MNHLLAFLAVMDIVNPWHTSTVLATTIVKIKFRNGDLIPVFRTDIPSSHSFLHSFGVSFRTPQHSKYHAKRKGDRNRPPLRSESDRPIRIIPLPNRPSVRPRAPSAFHRERHTRRQASVRRAVRSTHNHCCRNHASNLKPRPNLGMRSLNETLELNTSNAFDSSEQLSIKHFLSGYSISTPYASPNSELTQ